MARCCHPKVADFTACGHAGLTLSWSEGAGVKRSRFLEPLLAGSAAAGGAAVGGATARGAVARSAVPVPVTTSACSGIGQQATAPAPAHSSPTASAVHFSQQAIIGTKLLSVTRSTSGQGTQHLEIAKLAICSLWYPSTYYSLTTQAQMSPHLVGLPDDFFSWD